METQLNQSGSGYRIIYFQQYLLKPTWRLQNSNTFASCVLEIGCVYIMRLDHAS